MFNIFHPFKEPFAAIICSRKLPKHVSVKFSFSPKGTYDNNITIRSKEHHRMNFPLKSGDGFWSYFCSADEVQSIISGKLALKYSGHDVDAMKTIAQAAHKRSIADFQKVHKA